MASTSAVSPGMEQQFSLPLLGGELYSAPPEPVKPAAPLRTKRKIGLQFDLTKPLFDYKGDCAVLYDHEEEDAGTQGIRAGVLSYMDGISNEAESEEERVPWTNDGIMRLHGVLLEESLKALAASGNAKQKAEVLDWIFEPDFFADRWETGGKVAFTKDIAFTFAFACKLAGMDPDVLRDGITRRLQASVS